MASDDASPVVSPKNPSPEKPKGISRKKKSASQTEVLEKAYAVEKYPSEPTRTRLCRDLELSEKQLQIWFTHRRYKDRRDGIEDDELISKSRGRKHDKDPIHNEDPRSSSKKGKIDLNSREDEDSEDGYPARVLAEEHYDEELMAEDPDVDGPHEELAKAKPKPTPMRRPGPRVPRDPNEPPRKPGPKPKVNAQAAAGRLAILAIEKQLGGPLRDDGPPLGIEFDPLPPDAFQQPVCTEAPHTVVVNREGESENSDRADRADRAGTESKGNGDIQWRNGLMEKKKKIGHSSKPSRGEGVY